MSAIAAPAFAEQPKAAPTPSVQQQLLECQQEKAAYQVQRDELAKQVLDAQAQLLVQQQSKGTKK